MKIETQPLEDRQMKVTVEVEPETFEAAKHRAARELARRVKIPGFRPGKAPYLMVVRHLGEEAVEEEAIEHLVDDIYPKMLDEAKLEPYGPGSLKSIVSKNPPVLEFVVPLQAEVKLGEYQAVRRAYEPKPVEDKDVDAVLADLREQQALLEPVERPAQEGDAVTIRLDGERLNPEEGQNPTLVTERSVPILIKPEGQEKSENEPEEWPYPGFARLLIGLSAGDERTVEYTFPEDSTFESLRGVAARFHFVVESVKSRTLPEMDDEFAKSVGEFGNMEEVRGAIRHSLEHRAEDEYNETYDDEILQELANGSTIQYPPQMLEREIDSVIDRLKERLEQQHLDMDLYLKSRGMTAEQLREEARPTAESRLKKSLALMEMAKAENIEIQPDELEEETTRTLGMLSQSMSKKDARLLNDRNVFTNLVGNIMADMLTNRALGRLREIASEGKAKAHVHEDEEQDLMEAELAASAAPAAGQIEPETVAEETTLATEEPAAEGQAENSAETEPPAEAE